MPPTTVWSYGADADATPTLAPQVGSSFNYPAFTVESTSSPATPIKVRWINALVQDPDNCNLSTNPPTPAAGFPNACTALPHLLPIDQTLHWANPAKATLCKNTNAEGTDCTTNDPTAYTGPVPIVTHLHGAHVMGHSDGYPEAWWLPAGVDPALYTTKGTLFDDSTGGNPGNLGYADYSYLNEQPATTLWYHDHSLGMTRANVYAGPAGFWLVRGDYTAADGTVIPDAVDDGTTPALDDGILPGPAPVATDTLAQLNTPGDSVRQAIREIPIVIQDRSFNATGDLFYPAGRTVFDALAGPYAPNSDIAPIWNPETVFNTMVVNGTTWPTLTVAPDRYRLRLLNGCNSRFLNLSMFVVIKDKMKSNKHKLDDKVGAEVPFFQIGGDQGFLPEVVMIQTGSATPLPGTGIIPVLVPTNPQQALLMGLAERADVIVDFSAFAPGTIIRMYNTAPDAPFGGFPDVPADPSTTGQVMEFVVNGPANATPFTPPANLKLNFENVNSAPASTVTRALSLNEEESAQSCVSVKPNGTITTLFTTIADDPLFLANCTAAGGVPQAPRAALLGTFDTTANVGIPLLWTDKTGTSTPATVTMADGTTRTVNVTENPTAGTTETWEFYNLTVDGHPIHMHLVRFAVVDREALTLDPLTGAVLGLSGVKRAPEQNERGFKDTVIAYPGDVTRVKATFPLAGLYVWHCHILEHEDNEMMRPYVVSP